MSSSPEPLIIVIDHLVGSRRGQRQELAARDRVRFGRHPDCEVSFDAVRDIDASSRHAELRAADGGWTLVDVGSSNGTYVDGRRVTETTIAAEQSVMIELGSGGPLLRLFIGNAAAIAALPAASLPLPPGKPWWPLAVGVALAVIAVIAIVVALL
jgi:pSer/pThr/pTyr-binding forkhead associated (FHA) protein